MSSSQVETPVAIGNILFATDFTDASRKAFRYAKALARHFQSSVTAAHVLRASENDWPKFGIDPEYKKLFHETKRDLDGLTRQLRQAGFQADSTLLEGDPVEGIIKAIKRYRADLLVLGTHGSRDLERLVLGSTAEEVFRKASCPVLTVGPNVHDPYHGDILFRRIILATELDPAATAAAQYAFSLAAQQASHITICHVLPQGHTKTLDSTEMQKKFMQALNKLIPEEVWTKCAAEYVVEYGNAADEILKLAEKERADLIILGARFASAPATHLVPGVAFQVIAGAACPVLTVHK